MSFAMYLNRTFPNGVERFFRAPPGQRLVARAEQEYAQEVHSQRVVLAARVAEEERKLDAVLPDLEREAETAERAYAKAKAAADGAAAKLRIARNHKAAALLGTENQIAALRGQLRRMAPPQIEDLRLELLDEHQALREQSLAFSGEHVGWKGRRPVNRHLSNRAAVHRRLAALLEACRQLDTLKEMAVDDLPVVLKAIRDSIPSADVLEEYVPLEQSIGPAWAASA